MHRGTVTAPPLSSPQKLKTCFCLSCRNKSGGTLPLVRSWELFKLTYMVGLTSAMLTILLCHLLVVELASLFRSAGARDASSVANTVIATGGNVGPEILLTFTGLCPLA